MPLKVSPSVEAYLERLPADRRRELERVRAVVRKNLPRGYEETLARGIITYSVPLRVYPETYNGQALWYVAMASQKNYLTLYLMNTYAHAPLAQRLRDGFKAAGKKLDMGKCCVHFKSPDDLPLKEIGKLIAAISSEQWIEMNEQTRLKTKSGQAKAAKAKMSKAKTTAKAKTAKPAALSAKKAASKA